VKTQILEEALESERHTLFSDELDLPALKQGASICLAFAIAHHFVLGKLLE